jgi:hypothetical protein
MSGAAMPEIGHRLAAALADRYRIERELGAGGMATVYLAQEVGAKVGARRLGWPRTISTGPTTSAPMTAGS